MELRINQAIKEHTKVSYAIESSGTLPFDVDCGEGINIVMAPPEAMKAFQNLKFEMLQPYPHSVSTFSGKRRSCSGICTAIYGI